MSDLPEVTQEERAERIRVAACLALGAMCALHPPSMVTRTLAEALGMRLPEGEHPRPEGEEKLTICVQCKREIPLGALHWAHGKDWLCDDCARRWRDNEPDPAPPPDAGENALSLPFIVARDSTGTHMVDSDGNDVNDPLLENEARAIVRAVNSHAAHLRVVKAAKELLGYLNQLSWQEPSRVLKLTKALEAALSEMPK